MSAAVAAGPEVRLEQGRLTVRARRVEGAPVVALRAILAGGARAEARPGLALVAGRALAEGTARQSWREIADEAEALGMALTSFATFESHGVAADALAADWPRALDAAAELLLEPTFPPERCAWVARQAAAELASLADQPEVKTGWAFLDQLYHPHRRALPLQGRPQDLAAIAPDDCAAFHRTALARRAIVTVAGDLDPEALARNAAERFAGLAGAAAEETPAVAAPHGRAAPRTEVELPPPVASEIDPDEDGQAHLYLGRLTIPRRHPDYEALELAGVVLGAGAGLTGRIPERIREREGLAYTAAAQTLAGSGLDPGRLVVYLGTSPDQLDQAERGVREELSRLFEEGPTEAEVADAQAYLLGREPFERETARQWAELLAESEHYGLALDGPASRRARLAAAGRAEVAAAIRRHLAPEGLKVTVGVPAEG